jgi:hypothetical protein
MQQPTATSQHTTSSIGLALRRDHRGNIAIGQHGRETQDGRAGGVDGPDWLGSAGMPGRKSVPPAA